MRLCHDFHRLINNHSYKVNSSFNARLILSFCFLILPMITVHKGCSMLPNSEETQLLGKLSRMKAKSCFLLLEFHFPSSDSDMLKATDGKAEKAGLLLIARIVGSYLYYLVHQIAAILKKHFKFNSVALW